MIDEQARKDAKAALDEIRSHRRVCTGMWATAFLALLTVVIGFLLTHAGR